MSIYDKRHRSIDSFHLTLVDDSDGHRFEWDENTLVTIDNQPWVDAFDTDQFHKAEYVVTKPAEQPYFIDGEQYTFTKPRDELKDAQWRLDNLPWTLEHPSAKRVETIDQARGFWRGPYYNDDADEQRVHLYIPANDEEALNYAAEHEGVSPGFTHTLTRVDEYDGEVGGDVDIDNVDAFQTDIYYDHVATTKNPRLPNTGQVGDSLPTDMAEAIDSGHAGVVVDSVSVDDYHNGYSNNSNGYNSSNSNSNGMSNYSGNSNGGYNGMSSETPRPDPPSDKDRPMGDPYMEGYVPVAYRHMTPHHDPQAELELKPQVTDGTEIIISGCYATRPYSPSVHLKGDQYKFHTPSLGGNVGYSGPYEPEERHTNTVIELDSELPEDTEEVFVVLYYVDEQGERINHILGDDGWMMERAKIIINEDVDGAAILDDEMAATYIEDSDEFDGVDELLAEMDAKTPNSKRGESSSDGDGNAPEGIYVSENGTWYAVSPDEHTHDSTEHDDDAMYPLTSCSGSNSVEAAWNLRHHSDALTISTETLESRIRRAAESMNCELDLDNNDSIMTDIDIDSLTVDTIAEQHEGVAEILEENDSLEDELSELEEQKEVIKSELDSVREELDSYVEEKRSQKIDELTDLTERWDEDDLEDVDLETLDDRIALVKELRSDLPTTPQTDNGDDENGGKEDKYAGKVLDLSHTA